MDQDPFKEYLRQSEPGKRDKGYAWNTAIGLQAVDGLRPSKYLIETAIQNIEGKITIDEAQQLLDAYYRENPKADIEPEKADIESQKADIGPQRADIGSEKADIEFQKADIGQIARIKAYRDRLCSFTASTGAHVESMYAVFGENTVFGRADVQKVTGLKHTRASELLRVLTEAHIIEPVEGYGKGKYRFR